MMSGQGFSRRHAAGRRAALLLSAWIGLSATALGCKASGGDVSRGVEARSFAALEALDGRHEPLRADFERDASHPRLLVLASPT